MAVLKIVGFKISKPIIKPKIWHGWVVDISYCKLVTNTKKIIGMERVKKTILTELYESYIADYQELKIL